MGDFFVVHYLTKIAILCEIKRVFAFLINYTFMVIKIRK